MSPCRRVSSRGRSARGRDDKSGDFGVVPDEQRLPDGGMLRVDGIDLVLAHLRAEKQVTACDYRLLVGQCQLEPAFSAAIDGSSPMEP